ncbi:hypothetical protein CRG98_019890 [Punica granatum]|uniref:Uncharacterized protein n=1 Tax=Punica granatum TaxID=22663 RepID=A0A2I0JTT9_PUNGR|nr:hypothetical protein CRG98_019890 [Punica granatum]
MFPYSSNLIDGAFAQVILQVVGGHSYVEAVLAETIWSLDYVGLSDNSVAYRIFPRRRIALHIGSCGQTQQHYSQIGFYEFGKLDACGGRASFRSSTSRSIPLMRSKLSQQPQHMWLSSIHRDLHLFVSLARHKFRGHRKQTFQWQRASPKEPCARSCTPLGKSEIDSAESLLRLYHLPYPRTYPQCIQESLLDILLLQPCGFCMFYGARGHGESIGDQHDRAHGYDQRLEPGFIELYSASGA